MRQTRMTAIVSRSPFHNFWFRICFGFRICCFGFVLSASAQILRPIDPSRHADATDKKVVVPTISFGTVAQPTLSEPGSPLSGKVRERAGTIETKQVDSPPRFTYSGVPVTIVPHKNFSAKRAVLTDNAPAMTVFPTGK